MNGDVIRVFIGYDPVESVAWHTLAHSIFTKSTQPVAIVPINIKNLSKFYNRNRDLKQSNEFSFSRFLVPYLSNYHGMSIFMDCDMLVRCDITEIFSAVHDNPNKALYVVKHDYQPKTTTKYLGNTQHAYPRKNWSSVVVWNCSHPANKILTPEYVQYASGMDLHRFQWLKDDEIGELDIRWNWLVGDYSNPPANVKNVHFTIGGPYFKEYQQVDFSSEWFREYELMTYCKQLDDES